MNISNWAMLSHKIKNQQQFQNLMLKTNLKFNVVKAERKITPSLLRLYFIFSNVLTV